MPELAAAGERASMRFLEFFAANIRNPNTRRAYARAADECLAWCASGGIPSIGSVQPVHVATWSIPSPGSALQYQLSKPYEAVRVLAALTSPPRNRQDGKPGREPAL